MSAFLAISTGVNLVCGVSFGACSFHLISFKLNTLIKLCYEWNYARSYERCQQKFLKLRRKFLRLFLKIASALSAKIKVALKNKSPLQLEFLKETIRIGNMVTKSLLSIL